MDLKRVILATSIVMLTLLTLPGHPGLAAPALSSSPNSARSALSHPAGADGGAAAYTSNQAEQPQLSPSTVLGLICAIAASSLALGVAFALRRRINQIAGPDPDKEDE